MHRKTTHTILLSILLFVTVISDARTRKVLFIGNSYTYTNNIPDMLKQLAAANGDTLIYDQNTPGGYTLEQHSTNAQTIAKIKSDKWDVVVLQEQSQLPALSATSVATWVFPYAEILDTMIRNNNACTETMFYMTWGRKNGDASYCSHYPPMCTYQGMQQGLYDNYLQMAKDLNAVVAPVGAVWRVVRDSISALDLYQSDESHPSVYGSYLSACVFYASIFHRNPHGNTYIATLSAADAERIQYFAGMVTMDSLSKWQQHGDYVSAGFTKSIVSGNTRSFTNTSLKANSYKWSFGDMGTGSQKDETHTYMNDGVYDVTLTASNSCFTELVKDTVHVGKVGVNELQGVQKDIVAITQAGEEGVYLQIAKEVAQLTIYAVDGSKVYDSQSAGLPPIISLRLTPGLYFYIANTGVASQALTNKFSVY